MKILLVIPYYIPSWSYWWPLRIAHAHALEFIKLWWEVTILTTDASDSNKRITKLYEDIDWITVIRMKNFSIVLANKYNIFFWFWMFPRLSKNIKQYDIIHFHDVFNFHAIVWMIFAKFSKVPYVFHTHWLWCSDRINAKFTFIKNLLLKLFLFLYEWAVYIYAWTDYELSDIKRVSKSLNVSKVPNGIDYNYFSKIKRYDLRKECDISSDTIIFTYVWRIQFIKWLDIALRALSKLKNYQWKYVIIWPDEWQKSYLLTLIKTLWIENNIIWKWSIDDDKRFSYIKWWDVFLFTSRSEWFPMAALEALACQTTLLISYWTHLKELHKYEWVFLVDENSVDNILLELMSLCESFTNKSLSKPNGSSQYEYDSGSVWRKLYNDYVSILNKWDSND